MWGDDDVDDDDDDYDDDDDDDDDDTDVDDGRRSWTRAHSCRWMSVLKNVRVHGRVHVHADR